MKKQTPDHVREITFTPESAFKQMSELINKIQTIGGADKKESEVQKQLLNKEIFKLSKMTKDYFKKTKPKNGKKQKVSNKVRKSS